MTLGWDLEEIGRGFDTYYSFCCCMTYEAAHGCQTRPVHTISHVPYYQTWQAKFSRAATVAFLQSERTTKKTTSFIPLTSVAAFLRLRSMAHCVADKDLVAIKSATLWVSEYQSHQRKRQHAFPISPQPACFAIMTVKDNAPQDVLSATSNSESPRDCWLRLQVLRPGLQVTFATKLGKRIHERVNGS